jgi:hypothetical protein
MKNTFYFKDGTTSVDPDDFVYKKVHRIDGPAAIWIEGDRENCEYYIDNVLISKSNFIKYKKLIGLIFS